MKYTVTDMEEPLRLTPRLVMRTYNVSVTIHGGLVHRVYSAKSASAARAECWRDFISAYECTFKEFLRISRVRSCEVPRNDGYGYVRRQYDVDPKVGARVRLVNEGASSGCEGVVLYPGEHTAHVHVLLDGREHRSIVHPMSIEFLQAEGGSSITPSTPYTPLEGKE